MECKEIKKIIQENSITNLSVEDFNKFKEHLSYCKDCESIYRQYNLLQMLLKEYYKSIPVNWSQKEKALMLIEKSKTRPIPSLLPIYKFAIVCLILLAGFAIYKITFLSQEKKQLQFISELIYIHNSDNIQKWETTEYKTPLLKKVKKYKSCKCKKYINLIRFSVNGKNISLFILNRKKAGNILSLFKYYQLNNKYIYTCGKHSNTIYLWISDIPLENAIKSLKIIDSSSSTNNTIKIKTKKLPCPCCLMHLVKMMKKHKTYIIDINYKTSEIIINTNKEKISTIKSFF